MPDSIHRLPLTLTVASLLLSSVGWAQTTDESPSALKEQAHSLRQIAEQQHDSDKNACYQVLLVNQCLGEARQRWLEQIEQARALEKQARTLERNEREARQREREIKRDAELARRQQQLAEEEARAARDQASAKPSRPKTSVTPQ